jgi:DNA-binding response OmpR family regulator
MTQKTILYVEDDKTLSFITQDNLEQMGFKVIHFENGLLALQQFTAHKFDICLIDVMLPKMDGFELVKQIRTINREIPILFLSARVGIDDRITGLTLGGDDYLTKPYSMEELRLKLEVFLKRNRLFQIDQPFREHIKVGDSELDCKNQLLLIQENEIKLTLRETNLLELFFLNRNQILKRDEILMKIWGNDSYFNGRSLDVFVSRIRKYLSPDPLIGIESIRSIGFRLNENAVSSNNKQ